MNTDRSNLTNPVSDYTPGAENKPVESIAPDSYD